MATRNLTVMFTDIKGFTERTSGETRRGVADLLKEHHRLLVPVFDYFDGTVVKTIGDAFLVYFESPTDAVLCGVTIQEVLRLYNKTKEERDQLQIRVAINVGEVELKENDVHGEAVNIAARLEGVTEAGEVWFTDAVYQTMNRREAPSAEVGERIFKGIPYPIRVYKVIQDPNSTLAQTLASGIELTDQGPRIRGIRERMNGTRSGWPPVAKWGTGAAVVAVALFLLFRPSPSERAMESARNFMAGGDPASALEALDRGLSHAPGDSTLTTLALEATRAQVSHLEESRGPDIALEWLKSELASRAYLAPVKSDILRLDSRATVDQVRGSPEMRNQFYPEPLEALVARYPGDPEAPYFAARELEEEGHAQTILWLYRLALERGGFSGDGNIFRYCISTLTEGAMDYGKFDMANDVLLEFFPERTREWAAEALKAHRIQTFRQAWDLLDKMDDPLRDDLYFQALALLTWGGEVDMDELYRRFLGVDDPARREQILALHQELVDSYPKFTAYGRKRDQARANMERLKEAWSGS